MTMLRYKGGHKVKKGTYWDFSNGRWQDLREDGMLPGGEDTTYYRVPTVLLLLVGPIVGLAYVIVLPFLAIATVASLAAAHAVKGLAGLAGRSFSFDWRTSEAYLSGRKKKKRKKESKKDE
jgi:hypothetical protein